MKEIKKVAPSTKQYHLPIDGKVEGVPQEYSAKLALWLKDVYEGNGEDSLTSSAKLLDFVKIKKFPSDVILKVTFREGRETEDAVYRGKVTVKEACELASVNLRRDSLRFPTKGADGKKIAAIPQVSGEVLTKAKSQGGKSSKETKKEEPVIDFAKMERVKVTRKVTPPKVTPPEVTPA